MVLLWPFGSACAQRAPSIDSYKCSEFLADTKFPDTLDKFFLPSIAIAWATGFAAAHQQNRIRSDVAAMRSIAVLAGKACRKNPNKLFVDVVVSALNSKIADGKR
jgi:hypothetical protein